MIIPEWAGFGNQLFYYFHVERLQRSGIEVLENIGAQIYLGSLVGETAQHFIRMLPMRRQPTFSSTTSRSRGEASIAMQTGYQAVEYLSAAELYRLPAGRWPALVYINAQPRRDPILVDLDEAMDGTT